MTATYFKISIVFKKLLAFKSMCYQGREWGIEEGAGDTLRGTVSKSAVANWWSVRPERLATTVLNDKLLLG